VVPPFVIILKKNPTMVQNEIVAEHATFLLRFAHEQTLRVLSYKYKKQVSIKVNTVGDQM
jgi:hypothetical protein